MALLKASIAFFRVLDDEILVEAEESVGFGVEVDTTRAGYSGSGYVTGFDAPGDSLMFTFTSQAHVYEVRIRYALNPPIKPYALRIDSDRINGTFLGTRGAFKEKTITEVRLAEGTHTIVFSGDVDIDYLKLVPVHHPKPQLPPRRLSDPLAGPATQALFNFLVDQYGRHILAGQQGGRVNQRQAMLEDIAYVRQATGKDPAVGVFDLISYSRSRIERGEDPQNSVERWLDWAADDALVSLSWHWNAPTDLIDQPGREWWSGFYTRARTFDLAEALADTTSLRFQLLLGDIDAIAAQLHKFQDANVPILWRPLHEAWGEWFWWGARGLKRSSNCGTFFITGLSTFTTSTTSSGCIRTTMPIRTGIPAMLSSTSYRGTSIRTTLHPSSFPSGRRPRTTLPAASWWHFRSQGRTGSSLSRT